MKKTLYIGAKCVPSFYIGSGGSSDWASGVPYEPLTVVTYNGSWYISKIAVPASTTAPAAGTYWAKVPGYLTELDASFIEWAQEHIGDLENDVEELQGDVAELKDDLSDIQDEIDTMSGGLTTDIKNALLALFQNVAYVGIDGQDYYDDLVEAFDNSEGVDSIAVSFSGSNETFYDTDSIDVLRDYLTVTATLISGRTKVVTDYRLTGSMAVGSNTYTVKYGGKTATFSATVVWGFKLRATFDAVGTNAVETGKNWGVGKYTIATEIELGNFISGGVNFIYGNRANGTNNYLGLQYGFHDWSSPNYYYMWGVGIEEIQYANQKKFRVVTVFDFASATSCTCTVSLKNVTSGSNYSNTKSYTNANSFTAVPIVIGKQVNDPGSKGFNGTMSQFILEQGEWSSDKISAFLAG